MEVGVMPRKMIKGRLFIGTRKGRPRLRWMDDVVADLKEMKIKQWMEKTNGDWLLRRPRLTQGWSAERMDGGIPCASCTVWRAVTVGVALLTCHSNQRLLPHRTSQTINRQVRNLSVIRLPLSSLTFLLAGLIPEM